MYVNTSHQVWQLKMLFMQNQHENWQILNQIFYSFMETTNK